MEVSIGWEGRERDREGRMKGREGGENIEKMKKEREIGS